MVLLEIQLTVEGSKEDWLGARSPSSVETVEEEEEGEEEGEEDEWKRGGVVKSRWD